MISEEYRALNRELHSRGSYGRGGHRWAMEVARLREEHQCETVLDYGCGQSSLAKALSFTVAEYDPAIEGKEGDPDPADLVVSTDTLEHVEPEHLDAVLNHLHSKTRRIAFLVIATRPAVKFLADGRNAHLIVENADWWRERLEPLFHIEEWSANGREVVIVARPIRALGEINARGAVSDDDRLKNTKANIARVSDRITSVAEPHDRLAVLACYGPSLTQTWPAMSVERQGGALVSVSGAHDFLTERGVIPDLHIECDPRPHKAAMVTPDKRVRYLMASCCDPAFVDRVAGVAEVTLWHLYNGEESHKIGDLEQGAALIGGGGSVGVRAACVLHVLGYRRFLIHGMDCSFAGEEQHAGAHSGKRQHAIRVRCGDRWFDTSATLVTYARHFLDTVIRLPDTTFDLHGDGLLQAMCRQANTETPLEPV